MLRDSVRRFSMPILVASLICLFGPAHAKSGGPLCGDINGDGTAADLADLIHIVNYLFLGGSGPSCIYVADCNSDGMVDMSDLMTLVGVTFLGGPEPVCPPIVTAATDGHCLLSEKFPGVNGSMNMMAARQSECLDGPAMEEQDSTEYMYAEIVGDDLLIHHFNAYYNCCMQYAVTSDIEAIPGGYYVTVQEADTTDNPCPCMCYFNLETTIYLVEIMKPTMYVVELIHGDGYTVGIDTVWITGEESMFVDIVGNDLYIHHRNAQMNCCPGFYTEFEFDEDVIRAYERDSLGMCDCICYYNLRSVLYDMYPGTWIVELYGVWPTSYLVGVDTVVVEPSR